MLVSRKNCEIYSRPMSAVMLPSNIAKFRISPPVLNSPFGRFSFAFQGAKLFSRCVPEIRGHGETKRLHTHHYSENYLHFFCHLVIPLYTVVLGAKQRADQTNFRSGSKVDAAMVLQTRVVNPCGGSPTLVSELCFEQNLQVDLNTRHCWTH